MSIKSEAIIIRDETTQGANTASRVGGNLVDIADDLIAKQNDIIANTSKVGITVDQANDITTNNSKVGITVDQANDIEDNTLKYSYPTADASKLVGIEAGSEVNTINSKIASEPIGSDVVLNVVSLTQAEFDAGTKIATTFYVITD
tara:strand:- start:506 stop:943 length:438 start_codon:yes stop_codon:yes gene_type:complete